MRAVQDAYLRVLNLAVCNTAISNSGDSISNEIERSGN